MNLERRGAYEMSKVLPLLKELSKYLHFEPREEQTFEIICAAIIANRYEGSPIWLNIIGPAGSGKSEQMMAFADCDSAVTVSTLTPASLASGYGEGNSLLELLDEKILIIKDLSAITSLHSEARQQLFGYLRDAYDGSFTRYTGKGAIHFEGKFGIVACSTPVIEQGRSMDVMLGERFLVVRQKDSSRAIMKLMMQKAAKTSAYKASFRESAKKAFRSFFDTYPAPTTTSLWQETMDLIEESAFLISTARSGVCRDSRTHEIMFPVEVSEYPTRLISQLKLLALSARDIGLKKDDVNGIIKRMTVDNIPYIRQRVLREVFNKNGTVQDCSRRIRMSRQYTSRIMEELEMLSLLQRSGHAYQFNGSTQHLQNLLLQGY